MEIDFLYPSQKENIYLTAETGSFEEAVLIDKKTILLVEWDYTQVCEETTEATRRNPLENTLTEQTVEIKCIANFEGELQFLKEQDEKEIKNWLKELDYGIL